MERFIVAEITKNWEIGSQYSDLISQRFEKVINVNHIRGYSLVDWKLTSVVNSSKVLTETVIAIFELKTVSTTNETYPPMRGAINHIS